MIVAVDKDFPSPSSLSGRPEEETIAVIQAYRNDVGDEEGCRVDIRCMDITDETEIEQLSGLRNLELMIHSAGVRGLVPSMPVKQGHDVATAETMDVMTSATLQQTFHINTIGTFLLLRTVLPHLRGNKGKAVIMGSRMGSIGHNSIGGGYAYRASKAALNAVVKSFSIDEPEVSFAIIHPGRVESNLCGEKIVEEGAITAEESVSDMLIAISRLGNGDSGRFMDRFGQGIVW